MSIPDFQTAMLPLLKHLSDRREHSNQETLQSLAEHFKLSARKKDFSITTSDFTKDANDYATMIDNRIVLINGSRLCDLMIDHGIGTTWLLPMKSSALILIISKNHSQLFLAVNVKRERPCRECRCGCICYTVIYMTESSEKQT